MCVFAAACVCVCVCVCVLCDPGNSEQTANSRTNPEATARHPSSVCRWPCSSRLHVLIDGWRCVVFAGDNVETRVHRDAEQRRSHRRSGHRDECWSSELLTVSRASIRTHSYTSLHEWSLWSCCHNDSGAQLMELMETRIHLFNCFVLSVCGWLDSNYRPIIHPIQETLQRPTFTITADVSPTLGR